MPVLTVIVVSFVVAVFLVFMVVLGGASLYCALPPRRAAAPAKAVQAKAAQAEVARAA